MGGRETETDRQTDRHTESVNIINMEQAGLASDRVAAPPWDSLLPDVLSALVYQQEADGGVQVLVCVEGGAVRLPSRKIGLDYNAGTAAQVWYYLDLCLSVYLSCYSFPFFCVYVLFSFRSCVLFRDSYQ